MFARREPGNGHFPAASIRFLILIAVIVAVSVGIACSPVRPDDTNPGAGETNATVAEVVDGDTIVVRSKGDRERVRLIGIDTPETVHPTKPVECFGQEASERTKELLPVGTLVVLRRDVEARDRYGRLLAYVFRSEDGLFINLDLVLEGFAHAYRFPPNDALAAQFSRAESLARTSGLGLWASCPVGPGG